jgi:hypothetical protein
MTTEIVTIIGVVAAPLLAAIATVAGAWIGRRAGVKQASIAAESAAKQATQEAKAAAKVAVTQAEVAGSNAANEARKVVTADWEKYTGLLLKRLEAVETRATAAEKRIDTAETRAVISEERAIRWESLYRIAVTHMRELIKWASDVSHMSEMPSAPVELVSDL